MKFSKKNLGVILIEFAFAIPIFLVLIYYLYDLPKMRLMQRKMQFVAYEMASILQNIADQKSETNNPAITQNNIVSSMRIAYLSIYFGNTMNSTRAHDNYFPLGHLPLVNVAVIKKTNGKLSVINNFLLHGGVKYRFLQQWFLPPASIDPLTFASKFDFADDEIKVILDCCLHYYWSTNGFVFADGRRTIDVSRREAFGFLFVNPKGVGSEKRGFFSAVATFTPPPPGFFRIFASSVINIYQIGRA